VTPEGATDRRQGRIAAFWAARRARWTLPLVIIAVILIVATVDHVGAHRISEVDEPIVSDLMATHGGSATVDVSQPWSGFNPGTPAGAASSTPTLLSNVLPSAFTMSPMMVPTLNSNLLQSVEVTSTSPLTIQYMINPSAVWSDGVPVSADDFVYAWKSQRGDGLDVDRQPNQVATTLGYRDVASVVGSHGGKTVTVTFSAPFTDWRLLFNGMVPAHVGEKVGWSKGFSTFNPATVLSAGPYLVRAANADQAVLVRNPEWWGTKATLSQVLVQVAGSGSDPAWVNGMASSNQAVAQPSTFGLDTLASVSALPNTESTVRPSLSFLQLEFNVTSPITAQLAVRQAVAHAVNRTTLLADTFGTLDAGLQLSEDHLAVPIQPAYAASTAASEYDTDNPAAVDHLLGSIGFHRSGTGPYLDANGSPLVVRMAVESGNPWVGQVGSELTTQLETAGISVMTIPVAGSAGLAQLAAAGGYDLALVSRTASPYLTPTVGWYSDNLGALGTNGSSDWSHFDDPDVDQQFAIASQDLNPVTGDAVYDQIDDVLWDQMVALPLFELPALVANGVQLANITYNPTTSGLLWNVPVWTTLVPKVPNGT